MGKERCISAASLRRVQYVGRRGRRVEMNSPMRELSQIREVGIAVGEDDIAVGTNNDVPSTAQSSSLWNSSIPLVFALPKQRSMTDHRWHLSHGLTFLPHAPSNRRSLHNTGRLEEAPRRPSRPALVAKSISTKKIRKPMSFEEAQAEQERQDKLAREEEARGAAAMRAKALQAKREEDARILELQRTIEAMKQKAIKDELDAIAATQRAKNAAVAAEKWRSEAPMRALAVEKRAKEAAIAAVKKAKEMALAAEKRTKEAEKWAREAPIRAAEALQRQREEEQDRLRRLYLLQNKVVKQLPRLNALYREWAKIANSKFLMQDVIMSRDYRRFQHYHSEMHVFHSQVKEAMAATISELETTWESLQNMSSFTVGISIAKVQRALPGEILGEVRTKYVEQKDHVKMDLKERKELGQQFAGLLQDYKDQEADMTAELAAEQLEGLPASYVEHRRMFLAAVKAQTIIIKDLKNLQIEWLNLLRSNDELITAEAITQAPFWTWHLRKAMKNRREIDYNAHKYRQVFRWSRGFNQMQLEAWSHRIETPFRLLAFLIDEIKDDVLAMADPFPPWPHRVLATYATPTVQKMQTSLVSYGVRLEVVAKSIGQLLNKEAREFIDWALTVRLLRMSPLDQARYCDSVFMVRWLRIATDVMGRASGIRGDIHRQATSEYHYVMAKRLKSYYEELLFLILSGGAHPHEKAIKDLLLDWDNISANIAKRKHEAGALDIRELRRIIQEQRALYTASQPPLKTAAPRVIVVRAQSKLQGLVKPLPNPATVITRHPQVSHLPPDLSASFFEAEQYEINLAEQEVESPSQLITVVESSGTGNAIPSSITVSNEARMQNNRTTINPHEQYVQANMTERGGFQLEVLNVPAFVGWRDLKDLFARSFPAHHNATAIRADVDSIHYGGPRGGVVTFYDAHDAWNAIQMFNGYEWKGQILKVSYMSQSADIPGRARCLLGLDVELDEVPVSSEFTLEDTVVAWSSTETDDAEALEIALPLSGQSIIDLASTEREKDKWREGHGSRNAGSKRTHESPSPAKIDSEEASASSTAVPNQAFELALTKTRKAKRGSRSRNPSWEIAGSSSEGARGVVRGATSRPLDMDIAGPLDPESRQSGDPESLPKLRHDLDHTAVSDVPREVHRTTRRLRISPTQPKLAPMSTTESRLSDEDVAAMDDTATQIKSTDCAGDQYIPLSYQIPEGKLREAMITSRTSQNAFYSFKKYRGPNDEKITLHYCKSLQASEAVAQKFLDKPVLGCDIEWKSPATAGNIKQNVSIIQIACEDRIGLFHLALHKGDKVEDILAPTLKTILESPDVVKCGVAISGDCTRMTKYLDIQPRGLMELSHMHKVVMYGATEPALVNKVLVSLAKQVEQHLCLPLSKGAVRTSDWSRELSYEQCQYAADDAYASYRVYDALEAKRHALDPKPPLPAFAELKLPLKLAQIVVTESSEESTEESSEEEEELEEQMKGLTFDGSESDAESTDSFGENVFEGLTDEEIQQLEGKAVPVEIEDFTTDPPVVLPGTDLSSQVIYPTLPPLDEDSDTAGLFVGRLKLKPRDRSTSGKSSSSKPAEAPEEPMEPTTVDTEFRKDLTVQATLWAQQKVNARPETSAKSSRSNLSIAALRAYYMWEVQQLSTKDIAKVLRDPPLKQSTVCAYVAECLQYGDGLKCSDVDRLRGLVKELPYSARAAYWRVLKEAEEGGDSG